MNPTRVRPDDFDWTGEDGPAADLRRVVEAATVEDGAEPLDEAALLALAHGLGSSRLWSAGADGFGWRHDGAVDVVVHPAARRRGLGRVLAEAAVEDEGPLTAWSHGNHPGAAALAGHLGFAAVRDLWVMRRPLVDLPPLGELDGTVVRPFVVGQDEEAWLALNAEAFAHHPEQGGTTRADLDERIGQDWFDPAGFFLAECGGELVGFHWTKVHETRVTDGASVTRYGEVYVVGVSPRAQGGGLGRHLTLVGLHHLAGLGLDEVVLYVEADNAPAVAVYQRLGFAHAPQDTHVQYERG